MDNVKMMQVSILNMLYAVQGILEKVKGQELVTSLFHNFIPLYEDNQRSLNNVRHDLKLMESSLESQQTEIAELKALEMNHEESRVTIRNLREMLDEQNAAIKSLNEENEALLKGNAELVDVNRGLRLDKEAGESQAAEYLSQRDYWMRSSDFWHNESVRLRGKLDIQGTP